MGNMWLLQRLYIKTRPNMFQWCMLHPQLVGGCLISRCCLVPAVKNRVAYDYLCNWAWQSIIVISMEAINTLRLRQNGRYFADGIFECIFFNEKVWFFILTSLKLASESPVSNKSTLVQIMAWRWSGDKPLSEPMMVCLTDAYMRHSASMS